MIVIICALERGDLMRGRPKQPIDLVIANGRKNLGKDEIERRRSEEVVVPFINVRPPDYLTTKKQKEEFMKIAEMLLHINIFTELDEDTLARYVLAREQYIVATKRLNKVMRSGSIEEFDDLQKIQTRAFNQCRVGASDLGLTITSRARLVVPQTETPKTNKFVGKFGKD